MSPKFILIDKKTRRPLISTDTPKPEFGHYKTEVQTFTKSEGKTAKKMMNKRFRKLTVVMKQLA